MVQALHKLTPPSPGGNGRVERRPHDQLRLFDGVLRTQVPQELQEADLPRQVACAHATEHASGGRAEGQQARRPMLMPVTTRVLWLGVMDERVPLPLARPLAARRVGAEPTARVPGAVGGLLDRLDQVGVAAEYADPHLVCLPLPLELDQVRRRLCGPAGPHLNGDVHERLARL